MRFLVDMPLSPGTAKWLSSLGHDAIHASDIGLNKSPDEEITAKAREQQRIIITCDLDYPRILALSHETEPAIVLFRGGNYSDQEVMERLGQVFQYLNESDLKTHIVVIEKTRIRKRRLPL